MWGKKQSPSDNSATPMPSCTLVLLDPEPDHFVAAVGPNAERDVDRLGTDHTLIADHYPDCIEEHERLGRIERPGLAGGDLLKHRVDDRRYEIGERSMPYS